MSYIELRSYITQEFSEYPFFDWFEFNGTEVLDLSIDKSEVQEFVSKLPSFVKWEFEEGNGEELLDTVSLYL